MRSGFLYLWRNRERPVDPGRKLKVWLKRLYHLKSTLVLLSQPVVLRRRGASIGERVIVGNARISGTWSALAIGDESSLGRCDISLHDRVTIGSRVVINDGVVILTASHSIADPGWPTTRAPVVIGDYAWVATGAVILPGVSIGRGAVVGAGAVVRGDVPAYAVAIGNPAKVLVRRRVEDLDYSPVLLNAPFEAWTGPRRRDTSAGRS